MTITAWLEAAQADAERRGLPELKPLLESLAQATTLLRAADFNPIASPNTSTSAPASPSARARS